MRPSKRTECIPSVFLPTVAESHGRKAVELHARSRIVLSQYYVSGKHLSFAF
ncbi:MAG: hypothetical protein HYT12_03065 [Candidatus Liptonbacteria bacterium]|nr:hypothetical protein [Candidatus Liptonbacteria bacterium]